jgi:hypothetical protein
VRVESEAAWREALQVIRGSFADDPEGQLWFDATHASRPFQPLPPARLRPERLGYDGDALHLETDRFGVRDVYEAALLCGKILAYDGGGIPFGLESYSRIAATAAAAQLAREAACAELAACQQELVTTRERLAKARDKASRLEAELGSYRSRLPHRLIERVYDLVKKLTNPAGSATCWRG